MKRRSWVLSVAFAGACIDPPKPARDPSTAQVGKSSMNKPKALEDPPPRERAKASPQSGESPVPRSGPFERSSVWTVQNSGVTRQHVVDCSSLDVPDLRRVLRLLFAGTQPNDAALPAETTPEILSIEWREHQRAIATSRLFADGQLVRESPNEHWVERILSPETMAELLETVAAVGLLEAERTWCPPNTKTAKTPE